MIHSVLFGSFIICPFLKGDFWPQGWELTNCGIAATRQLPCWSCKNRSKHGTSPFLWEETKRCPSKKMKFCTSTWCLGGVFRSLFLARCLNNCLEVAELKEDTAVLSVTAGRVWRSGEKKLPNCQMLRRRCCEDCRDGKAQCKVIWSDEVSLLRRLHQSIEIYCFPCLNGVELWISKVKSRWSFWWLWLFSKQRKLEERCIGEEPLSHIFHCLYLRFCCARLFDWSLRWSNRSSQFGVFSTPSSLLKGAHIFSCSQKLGRCCSVTSFLIQKCWKRDPADTRPFQCCFLMAFLSKSRLENCYKACLMGGRSSVNPPAYEVHSYKAWIMRTFASMDLKQTSSETQRFLSFKWQFATFCN